MTPPRWVDEQGRPCATRSCPTCRRVIPVNRWPAKAGASRRRPYQVLSFVEWCGHQQEVILVPEGDGWLSDVPVLGAATVRMRSRVAMPVLWLIVAALIGCATLAPARAPLTWTIEALSRQDGPDETRWTYTLVITNPGRLPATFFQESVTLTWDGVSLSPEIDRIPRVIALGAPLVLPITSVFRRSDFEARSPTAPGRPLDAPRRPDRMEIAWQFLGRHDGGGAIILNIDVLPRRDR